MRTNKRKAELIIALGIGIGAIAAVGVGVFLALKSKKESVENKEYIKIDLEHHNDIETNYEDIEIVDEHCFNYATKTVFSFDDAYKIALEAAKEQFGENGFIVPASEKKALYVNISGIKRACYMFGADKMDLIDGSMKGLYHVDADTGEVFDNGGGAMKQIRFLS